MALLAEEIVEEWLNRCGYFTIRGVKIGVHEIDLLALAVNGSSIAARHVEVQASVNAVSYLCPLPKDVQKRTGRKPMSMKKRTPEDLADGVREWVHKKFQLEAKQKLRTTLYPGEWKFELVVHRLRFPEELELLRRRGIQIYHLSEIIEELSIGDTAIKKAAGSDLLELVMLGHDEAGKSEFTT